MPADESEQRMEFMLTLRQRGISDKAVLRAMDEVPREHFVEARFADSAYADQAIFALDTWLDRVSKDDRSVPLAKKIIADKPSDIGERCTDGAGQSLPGEVCDETVAAYASPRIAAGGPLADDVLQCRLKPLRGDDYNVTFTSAQWAELKSAFPKGVCDYSQPGVGQRGATSWLTYQDAGGKVVYGGTPMGPPPVSTPFS